MFVLHDVESFGACKKILVIVHDWIEGYPGSGFLNKESTAGG